MRLEEASSCERLPEEFGLARRLLNLGAADAAELCRHVAMGMSGRVGMVIVGQRNLGAYPRQLPTALRFRSPAERFCGRRRGPSAWPVFELEVLYAA